MLTFPLLLQTPKALVVMDALPTLCHWSALGGGSHVCFLHCYIRTPSSPPGLPEPFVESETCVTQATEVENPPSPYKRRNINHF